MNCPSNNARKFQNAGDVSKDLTEKYNLYIEASKEYLKASTTVKDVTVQSSLKYLSSNALYKANLVQQLHLKPSLDTTGKLEQITRKLGQAKVSGPLSGVSDTLHSQRIIFKSHQNRISAISKIPKATELSPSSIIRDLLLLESKLNELGIDRDDNFHDSLVSAQHSALLNAPTSSLGRSGVHLSSDLGESFMLLKPSTGTEDQRQQSHTGYNTSNTFADGGERIHVDVGLNAQRVSNRHQLPGPPAEHRPNQQQPTETWTSTVMTWGGFGSSATTPPVPPSPTSTEEVQDPHAAPSWNEQSVFMSSTAGGDKTSSATRGQGDSTASASEDLSRSTISVLNREGQNNLQGVANLLQTVKRLGDENAQLMSRMEQIKAEKDAQVRLMQNDVSSFKQDYIDKFRRVKAALRDYSASHPREDNPALQGTLTATNDLLKEAEERLARAREALAVENQQQFNKAVRRDGNNAIEQQAAVGALGSSSTTSDAERRQKDLERTVQALVGRLQKANDDNKRKDILLRTLDPSYVSASAEAPSGTKSAQSSHRSSSSSSSSSSSGRTNHAPPLQHPAPSGSSINSGGKGIAMNSPGSGSNRVSSGPAMGSPTPKKQPSSSSSSSMSKHPSTATLEALQQKANK